MKIKNAVGRLFLLTASLAFLSAGSANAAFILTLDDLGTAGIDVIISDDQGIGVITSVGATTHADGFVSAGTTSFQGSVGVFNVNLTTGISEPVSRAGVLNLNSINVSGEAGTLRIGLTNTGFTTNTRAYFASMGGTTNGSVDLDFLFDSGNAEFGGSSIYDPGVFGPGDFSDSSSSAVSGNPYSLTIFADITHNINADSSSFGAELAAVPLPAAFWLFCSGVLGLLGMTNKEALLPTNVT